MNINYVGQILSTTSLIFEVEQFDKKQCFYVRAGDEIVLTNTELSFRDYIEDKIYKLDDNATIVKIGAKGDVLPSFLESVNYKEFVESKKEQINNNNDRQQEWFEDFLKYFPLINHNEDNIYLFKTQSNVNKIKSMCSFNIRELSEFINQTPEIIATVKNNCYIFLKEKAIEAIEELNNERQKFIIEQDQDSVDEIDIIIEMINETVSVTSFESMEELSDAVKLWPPILLPTPFF